MRASTLDSNWPERASPMARTAWLVYALVLIYSGLTPWSGWRDLGLDPFAYLTAPVPHYLTRFDLTVNVLAYVPFGALVVLALHPRVRGWIAVLIAVVAGVVLAGGIEAAQSYLPSRVASNLDLATNSIGSLLGALVAAPLASKVIERGRLVALRERWIERDASVMLLLIAAWPIAQIYPTPMLFGNGDLQPSLSPLVEALGGTWVTLDAARFGAAEFVLAEAFVVAAAVLAVGLALASILRPAAPRYRLLILLLAAALATRSLAHAVQFGPERALAWLTPGAWGGFALGALSLTAASAGPRSWARALSLLAAVLLMVAVNIVPDNPYHTATLQVWRQGRLLNFNALAHWVSIAWPVALIAALLFAHGRPGIAESRRFL